MPRHGNTHEVLSKLDDAVSGHDIVSIRQCLKEGANPNLKLPDSQLTPLRLAVLYPNCASVVHELLEYGARYDVIREEGFAFIHSIASLARPGNKFQPTLDEILKSDIKAGHFWTLQITKGEHKGKTPVDTLTKSMREYYEITPEDITRGKDPKTRKILPPQENVQKNIIWDLFSSFWHHPKTDTCATELRSLRQKPHSLQTPPPTPTSTEKLKAY